MIDFKDVTFIIPIRFDSEDRKRNFKITIGFLEKTFDTNIIVMESDKESNEEFVKSVSNKVLYLFEQTEDTLFHRTRMLNVMTKMSKTNFVVNYDIDVLFKPEQYVASRFALNTGIDFAFPYSGKFYDIPPKYFQNVESNNFDTINLNECTLFNPNSLGGAIFFNKDAYTKIGLENENFISWGHEDWERIGRIEKMGYGIYRVDGVLYHLTHHRTHNSSGSNPMYAHNGNEYNRIMSMNKEQLTEHIKTWNWING
jgi:predicted glycosyltransferase involved in capsule biosynthesis